MDVDPDASVEEMGLDREVATGPGRIGVLERETDEPVGRDAERLGVVSADLRKRGDGVDEADREVGSRADRGRPQRDRGLHRPSLTALRRIIVVRMRIWDWILGKDEPKRRRSRPRSEELPTEHGPGEVQELRQALRHYASEAARSATTRNGMREIEELKRQLRERATVLAERERELDERERELEKLARDLRGSRRRRRSPESRRRRPSAEPASQDTDS
jgi:hypothetical protein